MRVPLAMSFTLNEWNALATKHPPGTAVTGVVRSRHVFGVFVELDQIPNVPALLEIIHFAIRESVPEHRIKFPEDYPTTGTRIVARILAWSVNPKDVRLTQLSCLNWIPPQPPNNP